MNNLSLSYTESKNWWKRSIKINSEEWRNLRLKILNRDSWKCNFCQLKLKKYMVVDHVDGSALNNDEKNLRINCPACDRIRHCGLSTIKGLITVYFSNLSQVNIVKITHDFYKNNKRVPLPTEIDSNSKPVNIKAIDVAEIRFKYPKSSLAISLSKAKGFFTDLMDFSYLKFEIDTEQK